MAHPAVRLLALAVLALAVLLALRQPSPPAPAKAPQLATTTTLRPPGYTPVPAGPPSEATTAGPPS
jgi:hypothetical protein